MLATIGTEAIGVERCVSCDAPLSGPYCAQCGERVLEPEALTLRHFMVHTVADELLNVDGTLWRTLRLRFVRPGRLSLDTPPAGGVPTSTHSGCCPSRSSPTR